MLTKDLQHTLSAAMREAQVRQHEYVTMEHVLYALLHDERGAAVLRHAGADLDALRRDLEVYLNDELERLSDLPGDYQPIPTEAFKRTLQRAVHQMQGAGRDAADGGDMIIALFLEAHSHAVSLLEAQGIERLHVMEYVAHGISRIGPDDDSRPLGPPAGAGDDEVGVPGDPLGAYCTELVAKAAAGQLDVVVGRVPELKRTLQVLSRRRKNNPVYVGEAGVGKTALVEGLAQLVHAGDVPETLQDAKIYSLDIGSLVAGTRFRGDFEERVKAVINAVQAEERAILFIDEIHNVIGAGATSGGSMDAGNMLKPPLASGELRCIGSTTFEEYKRFEKDRALARRFQRIDVMEPTVQECLEILRGLRSRYEEHHGVRFTAPALRAAVTLAVQHLTGRFLPDKAIDVLDEAGAAQALRPKEKRRKTIGVKEVEAVVATMARIPLKQASRDERDRLRSLESDLQLVVFGQDRAIQQLVQAVKRSRAGLNRPDKPTGSFLFTGPTGVGKTELAKQLAWNLGVHFERYDMSEFMEKHAVARLIGAPPGYVGFDQGGLLVDAVRKHPYSVVLLDEIEKAHADLLNILLQVMDHAELTDNTGKKADFRHVTLIMTSNVGARGVAARSVGFSDADRGSESDKAVERTFSPEFRNRLDAIVRFGHLDRDTMLLVVDKFMAEFEGQLSEKRVAITLSEAARDWLAERGYDRTFGARPLARLIQERVKDPLADELLFGRLERGGVVHVDIEGDDELRFDITPR